MLFVPATSIMSNICLDFLDDTSYERMAGQISQTLDSYSLPRIIVNPRKWIKVNFYRGVNSEQL